MCMYVCVTDYMCMYVSVCVPMCVHFEKSENLHFKGCQIPGAPLQAGQEWGAPLLGSEGSSAQGSSQLLGDKS